MNKSYIVIPLAIAVGFLIFPFVIYHGNQIMVVTSDSMFPTLKPHDLIVVEQVGIDKVEEGDIIAFDSHVEGIEIIAHRVFEISEDNGEFGIDTKGDHMDEPDHWTVYEDDLIGRVTDVVPSMGIVLIDPIRYSLVVVIVITSISLLKESMSKKKLEVKQLTCLRCSYKWYPRVIDGKAKIPETCPNKDCRSPYWRTKRRTMEN